MNWGNSFGTTIGPSSPHVLHESKYGAGVTAPTWEWPRKTRGEGAFVPLHDTSGQDVTIRVYGTLYTVGTQILGGRRCLCARRRDGRDITYYHGNSIEEIAARIRKTIDEGPNLIC